MRVVIIGAVACGASTAAKLRRLDEDVEIILLDQGEYMSFANCGLPYYLGNTVEDIDQIDGKDSQAFAKANKVDVRMKSRVKAILPDEQKIEIYSVDKQENYSLTYDKLVIATGASAIKPDIYAKDLDTSGIFHVLKIPDVLKIKEYIKSNAIKSVSVIGAGYIGLEVAEQLRKIDLEVKIFDDNSLPGNITDQEISQLIYEELIDNDVEFYGNSKIESVNPGLDTKYLIKTKDKEFTSELIIVAIGVKPNSGLAKQAKLELTEKGSIKVDEYLRTSDLNIYAGGDVASITNFITGKTDHIPLADIANMQGRIIAENINGNETLMPNIYGCSIFKCFSLGVAGLGLNENQLKENGNKYYSIYVNSKTHASYYPESKNILVKALICKHTFRLLGAQIIGADKVDKYIDILSLALKADFGIHQLENLELAYAPPFSLTREPVHIIAMIAQNIKDGQLDLINPDELIKHIKTGVLPLDTRKSSSFNKDHIENAINLPESTIRDEHHKVLDKNNEYIVYSSFGAQTYSSYTLLKNLGYKVKFLSGSYFIYKLFKKLKGNKTYA
jgi:NADPH-dependent 2,4-dienoyl-CoA reductase/sulfur reductase-like enzyme/rhodanese-related sulfurtransferase